MANLDLP